MNLCAFGFLNDRRVLAFLALIVAGTTMSNAAFCAETNPVLDTLTRAIRQFTRHHDRLTEIPMQCLSFAKDANSPAATAGSQIVIVKEKHGGNCGGDPTTAPRVATLKVPVNPGKVFVINPVTGEDVPISSIRRFR